MTEEDVESILSRWFNSYDERIQKQFALIINAVNNNTNQLVKLNNKLDTLNDKFDILNKKYEKQNQENEKLNNNFNIHNKEIQQLIISNFENQKTTNNISNEIKALANKMDEGFKTSSFNINKILTNRFDQLDLKLEQFQRTYKDFTESDDENKSN